MRLLGCSIALGVLLQAAAGAAEPPAPGGGMLGTWKIDPVLSPASDAATAASGGDAARSGSGQQRGAGGGHGGAGGGGMGGGGGMHGGGGHHGGGRHAGATSPHAADSVQHELGLSRVFAPQMTITALARRIRFEAGDHVVELDKDGTNVSGPGVGGTVALTAMKPDLVVETLTDSGASLTERYRLDDDGRHLDLHASLKTPGVEQPREFVRVFDRVDPPAAGNGAAGNGAAGNGAAGNGAAPAASPQR